MNNRADRFDLVLLKLSTLHNILFTDTLAGLWEEALAPYDIDSIERALQLHMRDPEPVYKLLPSTLIKYIVANRRDRAASAVAVVEAATRQATARQGVSFADPLINAAISQTGGWVTAYYCMCDKEKYSEYELNFTRAYERLAQSPSVSHPAYLPGRDDDGRFVVIGDEAAVDLVVATGTNPKKTPPSVYFAGAPKMLESSIGEQSITNLRPGTSFLYQLS